MGFKRDDEFKPACAKCGSLEFVAVNNAHVQRADYAIAMIVCAEESCQAVIGVLPPEAVWKPEPA